MEEASAADCLAQGSSELGLELSPHQLQQLSDLASAVEEWGRTRNLTGHKSAHAVVVRLILDALALDGALPAYESLADLGTGAGFPGLPLSIAHPDRHFVLVDARMRRNHFQRAMVRELGLANVQPVLGRLEEVSPVASAVALAQALAKPRQAAGWLRRWVLPTGWIAIPGTEANPPNPGSGFDGSVTAYRVPVSQIQRSLWLGRLSS